jgi:phospholipase D1/2
MREHLGIDVDELLQKEIEREAASRKRRDSDGTASEGRQGDKDDTESLMREKQDDREMIERRHRIQDEFLTRSEDMHSFNHDIDWEQANNPNLKASRKLTADPRVTDNPEHRKDVDGEGPDHMNSTIEAGFGDGRDSALLRDNTEVIVSAIAPEGKGTISKPNKKQRFVQDAQTQHEDAKENLLPPKPGGLETGTDSEPLASRVPPLPRTSDADIGGPLLSSKEQTGSSEYSHPLAADLKQPFVDEHCMKDPVNDTFYYDTWQTIAENNTKLYRTVFRCMPDSEVKSWKEYKEYTAYGEKFVEMQNEQADKGQLNSQSSPTAASTVAPSGLPAEQRSSQDTEQGTADADVAKSSSWNFKTDSVEKFQERPADASGPPSERIRNDSSREETTSSQDEKAALKESESKSSSSPPDGETDVAIDEAEKVDGRDRMGPQPVGYSGALNMNVSQPQQRRRRRATTRSSRREFHASDGVIDLRHAEELLNLVQGHLISWPYDW